MALIDTGVNSYSLTFISVSAWSMVCWLQNTMTLWDDWPRHILPLSPYPSIPCVPSFQTLQPLVTAGLRPQPVSTSQLSLALCLIQYAILSGSSA